MAITKREEQLQANIKNLEAERNQLLNKARSASNYAQSLQNEVNNLKNTLASAIAIGKDNILSALGLTAADNLETVKTKLAWYAEKQPGYADLVKNADQTKATLADTQQDLDNMKTAFSSLQKSVTDVGNIGGGGGVQSLDFSGYYPTSENNLYDALATAPTTGDNAVNQQQQKKPSLLKWVIILAILFFAGKWVYSKMS